MKSEQIQDSQHNFNLDCESESCSVLSDSLWPHGLKSPWNSPDQSTGVGSLSLLQGIFPTLGSNPGLPHCRQIFTSWATREAISNFFYFLVQPQPQVLHKMPALESNMGWGKVSWHDGASVEDEEPENRAQVCVLIGFSCWCPPDWFSWHRSFPVVALMAVHLPMFLFEWMVVTR